MKSNPQPLDPPPDEIEKYNDDIEKVTQTNDGYPNQGKDNPQSLQLAMKNPEQVTNNTMNQRMIEIATTAVIINNRITTRITLEIRPGKGNTKINVANSYKKSSLQ